MQRRIFLLTALLALPVSLLASPQPAATHGAKLNQIKIGHAWAPPTDGPGGAIYMPLVNDGNEDVRVTGASTPIAERVIIRTGKGEDAEQLDSLTLQPGQPLALAAWRAHFWMDGLERSLSEGDSFPLTLTFEPGRSIEIEVIVESMQGH